MNITPAEREYVISELLEKIYSNEFQDRWVKDTNGIMDGEYAQEEGYVSENLLKALDIEMNILEKRLSKWVNKG